MKSKHARHSYATSLFKNEYTASVFKERQRVLANEKEIAI